MTFAGGRQICSMACSGLLPNFLAIVQTKDDALPLPEQNGDVVNASQKEPVVQETKPILAIMTTSNKKRRDATTNKSKKSDMSSAILSTIMKYVFNKTVTISAPVSNSVDPAVAANIMAGNGVGMKGNKVSPSAPLGTTISVVP
eukprot:gene351-375_t